MTLARAGTASAPARAVEQHRRGHPPSAAAAGRPLASRRARPARAAPPRSVGAWCSCSASRTPKAQLSGASSSSSPTIFQAIAERWHVSSNELRRGAGYAAERFTVDDRGQRLRSSRRFAKRVAPPSSKRLRSRGFSAGRLPINARAVDGSWSLATTSTPRPRSTPAWLEPGAGRTVPSTQPTDAEHAFRALAATRAALSRATMARAPTTARSSPTSDSSVAVAEDRRPRPSDWDDASYSRNCPSLRRLLAARRAARRVEGSSRGGRPASRPTGRAGHARAR